MIERIFKLLIYVLLIVVAAILCLWALSHLGIVLPPMVIKIMGVVLVLFIILLAVQVFRGKWKMPW